MFPALTTNVQEMSEEKKHLLDVLGKPPKASGKKVHEHDDDDKRSGKWNIKRVKPK